MLRGRETGPVLFVDEAVDGGGVGQGLGLCSVHSLGLWHTCSLPAPRSTASLRARRSRISNGDIEDVRVHVSYREPEDHDLIAQVEHEANEQDADLATILVPVSQHEMQFVLGADVVLLSGLEMLDRLHLLICAFVACMPWILPFMAWA